MDKKISQGGNVIVCDDVVASIVTNSIRNINGFGDFCEKPKNIFNLKDHVGDLKYVDVIKNDSTYSFNVYVGIREGYSIPAVSSEIQSSVKLCVERALEKTVEEVNVTVKAVIFSHEPTKQR